MSRPPLRALRPSLQLRPVSLWTRIVALISLLLIAGTVITGSISLFLLNRTLIQSVDNSLSSGMNEMLSLASAEINGDQAALGRANYAPVDFIVEIRDKDGDTLEKVVHHHGDDDLDIQFPHLTSERISELQGRPFTVLDSQGSRWRVAAMVNEGERGGSVYVALPLAGVDRTMHEMAMIIVLVGTLVVLVGMGLGGYMTHRALEPLHDVETTASQIVAANDLSRRVPLTDTSLEVHALALALNEMLVRIEQAFAAQTDSEERATASEARMRRFVGDASHELRTPLAAIRGFGELYRMGALRTDDDVAQAMRRIEDEARRMGSLVENLLRLARLDEKPHLDLEPLDLSDALFDAAQDLRALDPGRRVMVVSLAGTPLAVHPHMPVGVMGDESSLRQVILNLVGNANRHTPKGSPVEIAVGAVGSGIVRIEVRDHGEGIDSEQRERVFERFYRTDESRSRSATQGGGAGLGLSIAATIVAQHEGRIGVEETPGGGATFWLEVPAAAIDPEDAVEPDQARAIISPLPEQED